MKVVCLGKCAVDWILRLDHFPEPDGRQPIRTFVSTFGGQAATACVVLARLGAQVTFSGAIGDDDLGRAIVDNLREEGIPCVGMTPPPGTRSARSIILSDASSGLRTILYEEATAPFPVLDPIAPFVLDAQHLHLDGAAFPSLDHDLLDRCRARGVTVSVDAGTPIPALPQFLAQIDVLVTTKGQLRAVSGEEELERGVRTVQKRGPRTVVVTMGEHGCIGASGPQPVVRMPPCAVEVIDTTGAGDVFSGALAYAIHRFPDLSMALRFASAAAALSCQGIGGRAACPTLDRVEAFLEVRSGADVP